MGCADPTGYVRKVVQRPGPPCASQWVRRVGRLVRLFVDGYWNAMVGSGSVYCGEQGHGDGGNVEAARLPRGDASLAMRGCSRRVFCADALTGALVLVASLGGCAVRRNEAEGSAAPAKQKANHPSAQKTSATSQTSWIAELQQDVEALVEPYGGSVSVYAAALDSVTFATLDGEVAVAPDTRRVAASIIKLPILACALETVAAGELSLDEQITVTQRDIVGGSGSIQSRGAGVSYSVDELLRAMIAQSDNVAANLVIGRLGMDAVNEVCASLGLTQTVLARLMMDTDAQAQGRENYTSARDAATVLQRLAEGTIATPELCERARGYLLAQEDVRGIVEGVPGDVSVAHKTGSLANAQHDAAIVYAERPYVLTVLTQDLEREQALALERDISSAIYAHAHS